MLFSIVVPVYNVEKYLDECMHSILSQADKMKNDCEVLLIDDGSTDNSGGICDLYKEKYKETVKVFHKKNEGLLATRRYGFKNASGDYIINCDSDDLLENGMLESVRNVIEKYNYPDIVFINHNTYDGKTKKVVCENIFSDVSDCMVKKEDVLREYMKGHNIVSVCGKIVKRTCINVKMDYVEYDRISTGEDTIQSVEFFTNANTFVYLNKAFYNYRCGSGMTAKFDENYYFTFKKIIERIAEEKDKWNLKEFDKLLAIKLFQTTGRAITQSRYKKWSSLSEQKNYLKKIHDDQLLMSKYTYLKSIKKFLQFDHYILLQFLENKLYFVIILLLNIKNLFDKI